MLGKPEWFTRRKWGGWGLYPTTWQGWMYIAVFCASMFATQLIIADQTMRMVALAIVGIALVADTADIMLRMKKDERETLHEALAERNALWAILCVLAGGVAYQAAQSAVQQNVLTVDPVIIIALVVGLIAKASSNYYFDNHD